MKLQSQLNEKEKDMNALMKKDEDMDILLKAFIEANLKKRHGKILAIICYLARFNSDKVAYIPKLKYFNNCGVPPTKIKYELEEMEQLNLISWNRREMLFQINYDTNSWNVPQNRGLSRKLCDYLTELNTY